jgi:hypothetical protein
MSWSPENPDYWPTRSHEGLLRAALGRGCAAVEAWRQWTRDHDIDDCDSGSFRLLPQLYRNLKDQGLDGPWMGRLAGVYRHAWAKNQRGRHRLEAVLDRLGGLQIESLVLKGAALAAVYYREAAARPMHDLDLMVRWPDLPAVHTILRSLGWKPARPPTPSTVPLAHDDLWIHHDGAQLDLHWSLLPLTYTAKPLDCVWDHAQAARIGTTPARILDPTDMLLHVFLHGRRYCETPPCHWVADAAAVLQVARHQIDWDRLLATAQRHEVLTPLRDACGFVASAFQLPVPPEWLARACQLTASARDVRFYRLSTRPSFTFREVLRTIWDRYRVSAAAVPCPARPIGFGPYLVRYYQQYWQLDQPWQVAPMLLRKLSGKARQLRQARATHRDRL